MCEVKGENDGRNTLQYIYYWEGTESSEPGTSVRERDICKTMIISMR
jgi:hypothetical protein